MILTRTFHSARSVTIRQLGDGGVPSTRLASNSPSAAKLPSNSKPDSLPEAVCSLYAVSMRKWCEFVHIEQCFAGWLYFANFGLSSY